MKTSKFLFALFACTLLLAACNKNDDEAPEVEVDYLIFGDFYGECVGDACVDIFKLEDGKLFEDSNDNYPGQDDFYNADFSELSTDLFDQVDGLEDVFPLQLLDESNTVIGMPDAGDWGGLYIEYKSGDTHRFWLLDLMKSNVSEDYHDFIDAVSEKIEIITEE